MSPPPRDARNADASAGYRVIVVQGLSPNVLAPHLREIFGEYGRVTGLDLPIFKVCEYPSLWMDGGGCCRLRYGQHILPRSPSLQPIPSNVHSS